MTPNTTLEASIITAVRPASAREKASLGKAAVRSALNGEWEKAVAANRSILELSPTDCEAANRLAKALMELGDYPGAKGTLEALLRHAPNNKIARKNLARLEQPPSPRHHAQRGAMKEGQLARLFIEEGGKSCTTALHDLADAATIAAASPGDAVDLAVGNHDVLVCTRDGRYLGRIEPRLGRRLRKLIAGGNEYAAAVAGSGRAGLSVMLRETAQHPALRQVVSFPATPRNDGGPASFHRDGYAAGAADDADGDPSPEELPEAIMRGDAEESAGLAFQDGADPDGADDESEADDAPAIPVLDADVDSDAWPAFALAAEPEAEWD